jgi:tetratricopeptide (TPR) repeat protein
MCIFKQQSFSMPVMPRTYRSTAFNRPNTLFKKLHVIVIVLSFFCCRNAFSQQGKCNIPFTGQKNIDSLKKILPSLHDSARIDCLNRLSEAYVGLPDWFNSPPTKVQFDTAEIFVSKALDEAQKINYTYGIAKALSLKAEIVFEGNSNYPEAEKISREAISFYKKTTNKTGLNRAYWRLGTALHAQSKFNAAINTYDTSYDLSKKAGDSKFVVYSIVTSTHVSLEGTNYEKAFEKVLDLHQLATKSNDSALKYWELELIAELYESFDDSVTAKRYYDSASKFAPSPLPEAAADTSNPRDLRFHLADIGHDYFGQNKYDKALPYLLKSLEYHQQANDVNQIMYISIDVAKTYLALKDNDSARRYAHEALALARQTGARQNARDACEVLNTAYAHLHLFDSAYFYYKQYTVVKDAISNDKVRGKLAAYSFEQKIELLNKEKEIQQVQLQKQSLVRNFLAGGIIILLLLAAIIFRAIILKRRNEKLKLKHELELQKLDSERIKAEFQQQATDLEMQALRAQMNPHFIFNSLNSINRFILKKQSSEATEYLTKFSRLIRMILNSSVSASVSLAEDLEALQLYIELERLRCEEKFSFKIECDPDVDADFIQVAPMLLQPFVENAIWHGLMSKESEGHLWVNINQADSTLICTITDDGIGRKKAAEFKNKSGKHKSMGMKITESRIAMMQKMNGENKSVEIRDLVDAEGNAAGTEVVLKIPVIE